MKSATVPIRSITEYCGSKRIPQATWLILAVAFLFSSDSKGLGCNSSAFIDFFFIDSAFFIYLASQTECLLLF